MLPAQLHIPSLVLDTNVALDWLVFKDPGVRRLVQHIESGRAQWLASTGMRDELERVLGHPSLRRYEPDSERSLALFDHWVQLRPDPPPAPRLVCRDADDQPFIDLAVCVRADWLLTRDRDLLALARRACEQGLKIGTLKAWVQTRAADITPAAPAPPGK